MSASSHAACLLAPAHCLSVVVSVQHGDAQLFEHNRRFQAAVLRTMEKQIAQMEEITCEKRRTTMHGTARVRMHRPPLHN